MRDLAELAKSRQIPFQDKNENIVYNSKKFEINNLKYINQEKVKHMSVQINYHNSLLRLKTAYNMHSYAKTFNFAH